jgi:hypothetical protein
MVVGEPLSRVVAASVWPVERENLEIEIETGDKLRLGAKQDSYCKDRF